MLTDPKSAKIIEIENSESNNEIINQIYEIREKIIDNTFKLIWIPEHVEITDNQATKKKAVNSFTTINEYKLHLNDPIRETKNKLNSQWEDEWKQKASNRIKDISDKFFEDPKTIPGIKIGRSSE